MMFAFNLAKLKVDHEPIISFTSKLFAPDVHVIIILLI